MGVVSLGTSSRSLNCSRPMAWTKGSLLKGGRGSSGCPFMSTSSTIALISFLSAFMCHTSEVCHHLFDYGIEFFRSKVIPLLCKDCPHFIPGLWHDVCDPVGNLRLHLLHF